MKIESNRENEKIISDVLALEIKRALHKKKDSLKDLCYEMEINYIDTQEMKGGKLR